MTKAALIMKKVAALSNNERLFNGTIGRAKNIVEELSDGRKGNLIFDTMHQTARMRKFTDRNTMKQSPLAYLDWAMDEYSNGNPKWLELLAKSEKLKGIK